MSQLRSSAEEAVKRTSKAVVNGEIDIPASDQCAVCFHVRPLCGHGVCQSRFCQWVHDLPSVVVMREGSA